MKREDAGAILADTLRHFMYDLQVEDGLGAVGYSREDVPALVKGTIPQVGLFTDPENNQTSGLRFK